MSLTFAYQYEQKGLKAHKATKRVTKFKKLLESLANTQPCRGVTGQQVKLKESQSSTFYSDA